MASITGNGVGWRIDHTINARPIKVSTAASCSNQISRRVGTGVGAGLVTEWVRSIWRRDAPGHDNPRSRN